MNYRRTRASDRKQIRERMEQLELQYDGREPLVGFVAEDSNTDELHGFSYVHKAAIIDPFACNIPLAARTLLGQTEGAISALGLDTIIVQVRVDNKDLVKQLHALGYDNIPREFILLKKVL